LLDGHSLKVAALTGEGLAGGSISAAVGGGGMTEVAATYAADDPAVAVIALGTNDAWLEQLTADEAIAGLETIVDALADACLVMVTITESASAEGYDVAEAREINDSIEAAADEVVDWRRISTSEVGLLRPDDIHPTPAGAEVFAAAIADAVERCPA
jgi:lysophospholipase L1-like esterase